MTTSIGYHLNFFLFSPNQTIRLLVVVLLRYYIYIAILRLHSSEWQSRILMQLCQWDSLVRETKTVTDHFFNRQFPCFSFTVVVFANLRGLLWAAVPHFCFFANIINRLIECSILPSRFSFSKIGGVASSSSLGIGLEKSPIFCDFVAYFRRLGLKVELREVDYSLDPTDQSSDFFYTLQTTFNLICFFKCWPETMHITING